MRLHGILGIVCTSFSFAVLAFNIFTPQNPDHVVNVAVSLVLTVLFFGSLWAPVKIAQWGHIFMFLVAAFISVLTEDGFFASALIMTGTFVITYAYQGFKTMRFVKLPVGTLFAYSVCFLGILKYEPFGPVAFARAAIWTVLVGVFLALLWAVLHEIKRQFFDDFAHELIDHNHDLLMEIRRLHQELKNGTKK